MRLAASGVTAAFASCGCGSSSPSLVEEQLTGVCCRGRHLHIIEVSRWRSSYDNVCESKTGSRRSRNNNFNHSTSTSSLRNKHSSRSSSSSRRFRNRIGSRVDSSTRIANDNSSSSNNNTNNNNHDKKKKGWRCMYSPSASSNTSGNRCNNRDNHNSNNRSEGRSSKSRKITRGIQPPAEEKKRTLARWNATLVGRNAWKRRRRSRRKKGGKRRGISDGVRRCCVIMYMKAPINFVACPTPPSSPDLLFFSSFHTATRPTTRKRASATALEVEGNRSEGIHTAAADPQEDREELTAGREQKGKEEKEEEATAAAATTMQVAASVPGCPAIAASYLPHHLSICGQGVFQKQKEHHCSDSRRSSYVSRTSSSVLTVNSSRSTKGLCAVKISSRSSRTTDEIVYNSELRFKGNSSEKSNRSSSNRTATSEADDAENRTIACNSISSKSWHPESSRGGSARITRRLTACVLHADRSIHAYKQNSCNNNKNRTGISCSSCDPETSGSVYSSEDENACHKRNSRRRSGGGCRNDQKKCCCHLRRKVHIPRDACTSTKMFSLLSCCVSAAAPPFQQDQEAEQHSKQEEGEERREKHFATRQQQQHRQISTEAPPTSTTRMGQQLHQQQQKLQHHKRQQQRKEHQQQHRQQQREQRRRNRQQQQNIEGNSIMMQTEMSRELQIPLVPLLLGRDRWLSWKQHMTLGCPDCCGGAALYRRLFWVLCSDKAADDSGTRTGQSSVSPCTFTRSCKDPSGHHRCNRRGLFCCGEKHKMNMESNCTFTRQGGNICARTSLYKPFLSDTFTTIFNDNGGKSSSKLSSRRSTISIAERNCPSSSVTTATEEKEKKAKKYRSCCCSSSSGLVQWDLRCGNKNSFIQEAAAKKRVISVTTGAAFFITPAVTTVDARPATGSVIEELRRGFSLPATAMPLASESAGGASRLSLEKSASFSGQALPSSKSCCGIIPRCLPSYNIAPAVAADCTPSSRTAAVACTPGSSAAEDFAPTPPTSAAAYYFAPTPPAYAATDDFAPTPPPFFSAAAAADASAACGSSVTSTSTIHVPVATITAASVCTTAHASVAHGSAARISVAYADAARTAAPPAVTAVAASAANVCAAHSSPTSVSFTTAASAANALAASAAAALPALCPVAFLLGASPISLTSQKKHACLPHRLLPQQVGPPHKHQPEFQGHQQQQQHQQQHQHQLGKWSVTLEVPLSQLLLERQQTQQQHQQQKRQQTEQRKQQHQLRLQQQPHQRKKHEKRHAGGQRRGRHAMNCFSGAGYSYRAQQQGRDWCSTRSRVVVCAAAVVAPPASRSAVEAFENSMRHTFDASSNWVVPLGEKKQQEEDEKDEYEKEQQHWGVWRQQQLEPACDLETIHLRRKKEERLKQQKQKEGRSLKQHQHYAHKQQHPEGPEEMLLPRQERQVQMPQQHNNQEQMLQQHARGREGGHEGKIATVAEAGGEEYGEERPSLLLRWFKSAAGLHLTSGAIAGAASRTVTAPLDRVKVVLQLHQGAPLGVWGAVRKIWRDERSLLILQQLQQHPQQQRQQSQGQHQYSQAHTRLYPQHGKQVAHIAHDTGAHLITHSSCSSSSSSTSGSSSRVTINKVCNKWHWVWACRGFFRGNLTNCVKVVPETAIKFWAYDFIKQRLLAYKKKQQHDGYSGKSNCAAASATVSAPSRPAVASPINATAAGDNNNGIRVAPIVVGPFSPIAINSSLTAPVLSRNVTSVAAPMPLSAAATAAPLKHAIEATTYPLQEIASPLATSWTGASRGTTATGDVASRGGTAAIGLAGEGGAPADVTLLDKFLCGALAGMIGQLAIYPMEIVKTRLAAYSPTCRYDGIFDCLVKTFQQGGLRKVYRGLGPSLLGIIPYAGIDLALFDTFKNLYISIQCKQQQELIQHEVQQQQEQQRKRQRNVAVEVSQSLQAEEKQQVRVRSRYLEEQQRQDLCVPVLKLPVEHAAVQNRSDQAHANVLLDFSRQWRPAFLLREKVDIAPAHGCLILGAKLRATDTAASDHGQQQGMRGIPNRREHLQQEHQQERIKEDEKWRTKLSLKKLDQLPAEIHLQQERDDTHQDSGLARSPPVYMLLLWGGVSSLCGQVVAYPTALVRTRVQIDGSDGTAPRYSNSWQAGRCALRDGWRGLYRGLGANLAKAVPAVSISWIVYEKSKDFIRYAVETQAKQIPVVQPLAKSTAGS